MIYLSENQLLSIKKEIEGNFNYYLDMYQSHKYPEDCYIESKVKFKYPAQVTSTDIAKALEWKYGHLNKKNYPESHKVLISKVIENWGDFCLLGNFTVDDMYAFWKERLEGHQNFITITYIIHLIKSDKIQIIDQHNFRAFNYFVSLVKPGHSYNKKPSTLIDFKNYNHFFNQLSSIFDNRKDKIRDLDKFLMMYGKYMVKGRSI